MSRQLLVNLTTSVPGRPAAASLHDLDYLGLPSSILTSQPGSRAGMYRRS
jgi:hypothetical protein